MKIEISFFWGGGEHAEILSSFINQHVGWGMLVCLSFCVHFSFETSYSWTDELSCVRQSFLSFCVWIWLLLTCIVRCMLASMAILITVNIWPNLASYENKELLFHITPKDIYI